MNNMLLRLYLSCVLFVITVTEVSFAAGSDINVDYSIEKSWVDIPGEEFVLQAVQDEQLIKLVRQYHGINKRVLENFKHRIQLLKEISEYTNKHLVDYESSPLINRFSKMVKRKHWYLTEIKQLYMVSRNNLVKTFYKVDPNNHKNVLYLKNSIEFDFKLPTYWGMFALEMLDPCKRMLTPFYYKWITYYKKDYPHFFAWLEGEDITFRTPQTKLFTQEELKNSKIKFVNGYAYRWCSNELLETEHSQEYIYILTLSGDMYVTTSSDSVKHTSLSMGAPVLGSGSIKSRDGRLTYIDNESGHYRPDPYTLQEVLKFLTMVHGVDISNVKIKYYYQNNIVFDAANKFIKEKFDIPQISHKSLMYNFQF